MQLRPHQKRALDAIQNATKGCVYVPTGGGKTVIMMEDCVRKLDNAVNPLTIVVVAPRILLAEQLCSEFLRNFPASSCSILTVLMVMSTTTTIL